MKQNRFVILVAILSLSIGLLTVTLATAKGIRGKVQGNSILAQETTSQILFNQALFQDGQQIKVIRAYYTDPQMVNALGSMFEHLEIHRDQSYVVVVVTPDQYELIKNMGFRIEIDQRKTDWVNKLRKPAPGQITGIPGYPCYRTVEETFATAEDIVAQYPNLATWNDEGDSWEKLDPGGNPGYDLMVLKLTNSAIPGPKPKLYAEGSIHAREYTTAELLARFAEYLVQNYNVDADVTWLLDHNEIHLMFYANPDGRKHAEDGEYWRKNTNTNYCKSYPSDRGADLNRNFEFEWNCCGGSSSYECDETYHGPRAASEPETNAVQDYLRAEFPDQREDPLDAPAPITATGVFLDVHSYSQLVLWAWGGYSDPAPNGTGLQTLGRKLAYFNNYTPQQSIYLYPTDGTTVDFAYGDLGLAAYTYELGTDFFQDCNTFENTILPDNMESLFYAAKIVRTPYMTPAGPDSLAVVASPSGVEQGDLVQLTATIDDTRYYQSNGNEPTQNIAAAEYYIDTPPWITPTNPLSMEAVDGSFNAKEEDVTATIDTATIGQGRHIIYVRGQDVDGNWGPVGAAFLYVLEPGVAPVITGYVREAGTNLPLEATVNAGSFQGVSDPTSGLYSMMVISGTYDLNAIAADHAISTVHGLQAQDYQTIEQDFLLWPSCEVFADDVEAGNLGWTKQSPWDITDKKSKSPTHSWTDSPSGNYGNNKNISLTSPTFDLSTFAGTSLSFWHVYDLEPSFDFGYVEVSSDGGGNWTTVADFTGYDHWTWTKETIQIPQLDGSSNAKIRFRLYTDNGAVADGWYIDDINLSGGGPDCVELSGPTAEFTSNSPTHLGNPVAFTNQSYGTQPMTFDWDFGDGAGASTETDPVYLYDNTGTYSVTLIASNIISDDQVVHTVVILPSMDVTPSEAEQSVDAGLAVTYTLRLTNMGVVPETYALELMGNAWATTLSDDTIGPLNPGEYKDFTVVVQVPSDADGGDADIAMVEITSPLPGNSPAIAKLTTSAKSYYGMNLTAGQTTQVGHLPGSQVTYDLLLDNLANRAEDYKVEVSSNWEVIIVGPDGEFSPGEFVTVGRGESVQLQVIFTVPMDAIPGESDQAQVTVTSQGDPTVSEQVTFTTDTFWHRIFLTSLFK